MALLEIINTKIAGVSACVPKRCESNLDSPLFQNKEDAQKFINNTGVSERRIAEPDICTSDLCYEAANQLIDELKWERNEIEFLVFITQTPDFIVPATSCILQDRLGLSKNCYALDVTLGCSGWVYGLSLIGSLLSSGNLRKGLLLVGETTSKTKSKEDKSTYPLFGDAGTATAIEYNEDSKSMVFDTGTDGSKYQVIYIPDGAFRNPVSNESLLMKEFETGIIRNKLQYIMDGAEVFMFAIRTAPNSLRKLIERYDIEVERVDYLLLHQANKIIVDKIKKKLSFSEDQTPTTYQRFGNTSLASIPLTIVDSIRKEVIDNELKFLACGFGGGLSWASVYFETHKINCPKLIEI